MCVSMRDWRGCAALVALLALTSAAAAAAEYAAPAWACSPPPSGLDPSCPGPARGDDRCSLTHCPPDAGCAREGCHPVRGRIAGHVLVLDAWLAVRGGSCSKREWTVAECCALCQQSPSCSAWTYCNSPEGCSAGCMPELHEFKAPEAPSSTISPVTYTRRLNPAHTCTPGGAWAYGTCSLLAVEGDASPEAPPLVSGPLNNAGWVSGLVVKRPSGREGTAITLDSSYADDDEQHSVSSRRHHHRVPLPRLAEDDDEQATDRPRHQATSEEADDGERMQQQRAAAAAARSRRQAEAHVDSVEKPREPPAVGDENIQPQHQQQQDAKQKAQDTPAQQQPKPELAPQTQRPPAAQPEAPKAQQQAAQQQKQQQQATQAASQPLQRQQAAQERVQEAPVKAHIAMHSMAQSHRSTPPVHVPREQTHRADAAAVNTASHQRMQRPQAEPPRQQQQVAQDVAQQQQQQQQVQQAAGAGGGGGAASPAVPWPSDEGNGGDAHTKPFTPHPIAVRESESRILAAAPPPPAGGTSQNRGGATAVGVVLALVLAAAGLVVLA